SFGVVRATPLAMAAPTTTTAATPTPTQIGQRLFATGFSGAGLDEGSAAAGAGVAASGAVATDGGGPPGAAPAAGGGAGGGGAGRGGGGGVLTQVALRVHDALLDLRPVLRRGLEVEVLLIELDRLLRPPRPSVSLGDVVEEGRLGELLEALLELGDRGVVVL